MLSVVICLFLSSRQNGFRLSVSAFLAQDSTACAVRIEKRVPRDTLGALPQGLPRGILTHSSCFVELPQQWVTGSQITAPLPSMRTDLYSAALVKKYVRLVFCCEQEMETFFCTIHLYGVLLPSINQSLGNKIFIQNMTVIYGIQKHTWRCKKLCLLYRRCSFSIIYFSPPYIPFQISSIILYILWHINSLLRNDHGISKYTTAVAE